jgi:hypothetical protein
MEHGASLALQERDRELSQPLAGESTFEEL